MRRFAALVSARNKEFYRDHSTLIWTFIFPLIVMVGFGYGYSGREEPMLKIGVFPPATAARAELKEFASISQLQLVPYETSEAGLARVTRHQLDMLIQAEEPDRLTYWVNPESSKASLVDRLFRMSLGKDVVSRKQELPGKKIRYAEWLVPGLIGMNLMFGALFGVGYVIVRYRKNGVLKRLRATPLSAFEFLLAQVASRGLLLLVTSSMTLGAAILLIGFHMEGSWIDLLIFIAVGCTSLIALGLLVAARISSEEVADGVLNLMTWPMMFLSGVWFSLDGASPWVMRISQALPLTHIVHGLRAIMIEGATLRSLAPELTALGLASVVLLALGSLIFRWR